jgi:hypothetical protein
MFKSPLQLIQKFDDNNYLTINSYPYSKPNLCAQYIYWTLNFNTHSDVLNNLFKYNILNSNSDYIIWCNSPKSQSIKTIKHYHIICRDINKPIQIEKPIKQYSLKKIVIVARHGPREPVLHLPKLDKFNPENTADDLHIDKNITGAQLTKHGVEFCTNFGKYIRKLFGPYFNFDISKSTFKSSCIDRTINSAICFAQGMFGIPVNKDFVECINSLYGDIQLNDEQKIQYKKIHDLMILSNANKELDTKIKNIFGYDISNPKDYFNVLSTLYVYKEHDLNIPQEFTPDDMYILEQVVTEYYYKLFSETEFKYIFTNALLKHIEQIIDNPNINFAYLSTHDVVVYPLALRFTKNIIKLPEFCSSVRIEIYDNETRIYYDDNLLKHIE